MLVLLDVSTYAGTDNKVNGTAVMLIYYGWLFMAGVPKTTYATVSANKLINDFKVRLYNRHNDKLCDTVTDFDSEAFVTTVPAGDEQLALIVRVNQANQVPARCHVYDRDRSVEE